MEFAPIIQSLAKVLNFAPPALTPVQDDSEFSVFATSSGRTVIAPTPWVSDGVVRAATKTDNRRVVKEVFSFGKSTLAKYVVELLEIDNELIVYMRSTHARDWDPAKPFGLKVAQATREMEKLAKQSQTTASLRLRSFAHLWPLVTSDKFVLEAVSTGYRIEFTANPPTMSRVWWTCRDPKESSPKGGP